MPETGVENIGHDQILRFEEIERVVRAAAALGFRKFRLTGGEPLVRNGILRLVEKLADIEGVEDLTMTTNGVLLDKMAAKLKAAGLKRINVSLDTLRPERFRAITRGGEISAVLRGIQAAEDAGLAPVRLNVVALHGFNDDEILDFAEITKKKPFDIRFIELMPIGSTGERGQFISTQDIRKALWEYIPLVDRTGVAEYVRYPGAPGRVGLISPISSHFCGSCNKIRLTADGKIKTCLHSNREVDIRPALRENDGASLLNVLEKAVREKEERHYINEGEAPVARGMNKIGG
jgi:cyclic pyranopterin phosphate synthase